MFFDTIFTEILRDALPWAGPFFIFITELGSELFYITLLLIGYWAYRKKDAVAIVYVLLFSVVSNYFLKSAIRTERPPETNWYPGVGEVNYSTPSGHAQNSTMLFGWLALKVKTWWMIVISTSLVFLIGISRVYLGVHYLGDVLVGWIVGLVFLFTLFHFQDPINEYLSRYRREYLFAALFLFGLGALLVMTFLLPPPPNDNFGALAGLVMGITVSFYLEERYVGFDVNQPTSWKLVLRVVIGLIVALGLMLGLAPILPTGDVWLRTIRYFLVAFWGAFLWPLIFTKVNL